MKRSSRLTTRRSGCSKRLRHVPLGIGRGLLVLLLVSLGLLLLIQAYVFAASAGRMSLDLSVIEERIAEEEVDAILVLGASVLPDRTVSSVLAARLDRAVLAYEAGFSDSILVSGDYSTPYYNEVGAMRDYLLEQGIPDEAILMDPAGLDTYDSIERAKTLFDTDSLLICTQSYHMHRALYMARELGIRSWGFAAENWSGSSMMYAQIRETFARVKAVIEAELLPLEPVSCSEIDQTCGLLYRIM